MQSNMRHMQENKQFGLERTPPIVFLGFSVLGKFAKTLTK
jgi:hypothetical protein